MSTTTQQPPTNAKPDAMTAPAAGQVARQEFGAQQLEKRAETSTASTAAQAQALVQARYIVALQRPRDWDEVRTRLLREVEREGFAQEAWYRKPVGEGVEGLTVRFAEAAMRCMGNILISGPTLYEDDGARMNRVEVTDLENNITIWKDILVQKTVERRYLAKGQESLGVRTNSQGKPVYTVRATEDDMLAKEAALFSKHMRTGILRILPGDIKAAAQKRIRQILEGAASKDPDAEKRRIVDAFAELNVMPTDLKLVLGHELAACSPKELVDLRGLYSAIKNGETTWAEILAAYDVNPEAGSEAPKKPALASLTERLKTKAAEKPERPTEQAPVPSPVPPAAMEPEATAPAPAPATDCRHPAISRYAKEKAHRGKTLVCNDCTLNIHIGTDGSLSVAGATPSEAKPGRQRLSE